MNSYKKNSLLDDFELPTITHDAIKSQLNKITQTHSVKKSSASYDRLPLNEKLKIIKEDVLKTLGRYRGFVKVIYTKEELEQYIDYAIKKDCIAVDTETNKSLDPLTCKLMGLCLYVPNTKPVYVPISHCKPNTEELLENQVSLTDASLILNKLVDANTKIVYHNGKFDLRVIKNTLGFYLPIWWDTMLAAQLIDENEKAGLKSQFAEYIDPTIGSYNIEKLFTGVPYEYVDPEIFALYSAIDSYDTYKLQQHQQHTFEQEGMERLYNLFLNVEVPTTRVVAEMEDTGITLDMGIVDKLSKKFNSKMNAALDKLNDIIKPHQLKIEQYQRDGKLDNPLNFNSSEQLKLILYEILGTKPLSPELSTDKATLKELKTPFTKALLEYRHNFKLLSSFIDTLPLLRSPKDGKIHASFNQMGKEDNNVVTGRFSSTDPNLQQIPSHEKTMRLMFKASPGYAIVGGDFKAQEPRMLTFMSGDETLRETFEKKRDPYATLAAPAFHKDYWDCMEHYEDGTNNPTGKEWRSKGKVLMLGIMYGMGAKTMSNGLGIDIDECKKVLEDFYAKFPKISAFTKNNEKMARELGYVEDYMGRRRHLPDINLDELVFRAYKKKPVEDVFIEDLPSTIDVYDAETSNEWKIKYDTDSTNTYKKKPLYKEQAKLAGVEVQDNGAFISKTLTQCTNARIQGGAATLTKKAMVSIHTNKRLNELGFRLLIPVHDELLGECPIENAEECEKLLTECMVNAGKPECTVPMGTDTYIVKHWYADEVAGSVRDEFVKATEGNKDKGIEPISKEDAIIKLKETYSELNPDCVEQMCYGTYDVLSDLI